MTWEDFYDKFYDWARSTQIKHLSSVDHLGSEDEVAEVLMEFAFDRKDIANRMARKAINEKLKFSAENLMNFKLCIDDDLLDQLAIQSADSFTKDDIEELWGLIDDDALAQIQKVKGLPSIFEMERAKQPTGFFSKVALAFGIGYGVRKGIDAVKASKRPQFHVGDHVRVKYRGQEGTIIDINGDLYMVSLNDGGYVDSFEESQLEKAW